MSAFPLYERYIIFSPPVAWLPFLASINGLPLLFVIATLPRSLDGREDASCCVVAVEVTTDSAG